MSSFDYDVIIVGGSFAGLAVAMQLRGRRVLVVDQYPIGSHQMSACGTPLATARAVGAEASILETHPDLVLHAGRRIIRFPLRDPYVTFDYRVFCQAMAAQTDAEVWQARATSVHANRIETTNGSATSKYVVNASGWRSLLQETNEAAPPGQSMGYALETELPLRWDDPGLHFFFLKQYVPNGYAWIFPCGATTRFGVGSFSKELKLRKALVSFLDRYGLKVGDTHGGVLAIARRAPLHNGVFLVGDAAGQCLPVTGEGIRTAIFHGIHCGRAIARALAGDLTAEEARNLYVMQVKSMDRFHRRLLAFQNLIARTPEAILALAGQICARPALTRRIMDKYWNDSGWFVGQNA